jgi:hypothetical protein
MELEKLLGLIQVYAGDQEKDLSDRLNGLRALRDRIDLCREGLVREVVQLLIDQKQAEK